MATRESFGSDLQAKIDAVNAASGDPAATIAHMEGMVKPSTNRTDAQDAALQKRAKDGVDRGNAVTAPDATDRSAQIANAVDAAQAAGDAAERDADAKSAVQPLPYPKFGKGE